MTTIVKARYSNGVLKPLESLPLKEGEEVSIAVELPVRPADDWRWGTAGTWAGLLDCDKFEKDVYESRILNSRPAPEL